MAAATLAAEMKGGPSTAVVRAEARAPARAPGSTVADLKAYASKLSTQIERFKTDKRELTEQMQATGRMALHSGEMLGATFVTGTVTGWLGPQRLRVMGVDARVAVGLAGGLFGLWQSFTGRGGEHVLALSTGVLSSPVHELAVEVGTAIRNRGAPGAAPLPAAAPAPALRGTLTPGAPAVSGALTPWPQPLTAGALTPAPTRVAGGPERRITLSGPPRRERTRARRTGYLTPEDDG